ncbi:MAG: hypothetical protein V1742_01165 [Pseudomonadota bacterium]
MKIECPHCDHTVDLSGPLKKKGAFTAQCPQCEKTLLFQDGRLVDMEAEVEEIKLSEVAGRVKPRDYAQLKRYLKLVVILLALFLVYQLVTSWRQGEALAESRNAAARAALRNLATAQEAYYSASGIYTNDLADLSKFFHKPETVVVNILRADASAWEGRAYHHKSNLGYIYKSDQGGLQEETFQRETKKDQAKGAD